MNVPFRIRIRNYWLKFLIPLCIIPAEGEWTILYSQNGANEIDLIGSTLNKHSLINLLKLEFDDQLDREFNGEFKLIMTKRNGKHQIVTCKGNANQLFTVEMVSY